MYASFFGFEKVPFNGIPDSDEMVAHRSFERAHATLRDGVLQGARVLLLCGEPGAGKTTLLHNLRAGLKVDGFQACLLSACVDAGKLAELGAGALGALGGMSVPGTSNAVRNCDGLDRSSMVILADDAHLLGKDKLRFFSDLISGLATSQAPVQIVFAGDSSLDAVLTRHGVDAIASSVQVRAVLAPLEPDEVAQYVSTKLQVAGCHQHSLLDERVVDELARRSEGNPSRIDTLCGMVLLIAYDSGKKHVEPAMVAEAVHDLDGDSVERLDSLATCAYPTAAGEEASGPAQVTPRASATGWRPAVVRMLGNVRGLAPAATGTVRRALRRSRQSIGDTWRFLRHFPGARRRRRLEPRHASAADALRRTHEHDWLALKIGFVGLFAVAVIVIAVDVAQDRASVVIAMAPPSASFPDLSPAAAPSPPSSASVVTKIHALERALAASRAQELAKERVLTEQQARIEELQQQTAELEARLATAGAVAPTRFDESDAQEAGADGTVPSPVAALPADPEDGPHGDGLELASILASPFEGSEPAIPAQPTRTAGAGPQAVPPGAGIALRASGSDRPDDSETEPAAVDDRSNPADADADAGVAGAADDVRDVTAVDSSAVDAVRPEPSRLRQSGDEGRAAAADAGQAKTAPPRQRHTVKPVAARVAATEHRRVLTADTRYAAVSARLLDAAERGDGRLVQELLGAGASVNVRDEEGRTPLMRAAGGGHLEVARILLDRGAAIGAANTSLGTALAYAAWSGHTTMVAELLSRGSRSDSTNGEGWTPLMYAAINGHVQSVKELLDRGADVNARNREGRTALLAAVWNGHTRLAHALLDRGADVNAKTQDGWTPLIGAAFNGDSAMVGLLLDRGADRSARTRTGLTAMAIARGRGHDDIAQTLSRHRTGRQASGERIRG